MAPTLILYGSKARGDFRANSDVDLILALEGHDLGQPTQANGVSVHRYPKGWLETGAAAGSLFVFHIAFEGVVLEDPDDFLSQLRVKFERKTSYSDEIKIAALVLKMLLEKDWESNFDARRRYFWALRTVLISAAAEVGEPMFSSGPLEEMSAITGLADLIDGRDTATFADCLSIGTKVLAQYLEPALAKLEGPDLREHLMGQGGIALDSVRIIEEGEAIADIGLAVYL